MSISLSSLPELQRYTIIFHDGTIEPPVILDLNIDSCGATQNQKIYLPSYDYNKDNMIFGVVDRDSEDFGSITDSNISSKEDYGDVTVSAYYIAPTKCQTYEQDLGIQELITMGGFDDYRWTHIADTRYQDDGSVLNSASQPTEDWGLTFEDKQLVTQLRLGPIRRNIERHKFKKQGGFSQTVGVAQQSGTTIANFKDEEIWQYVHNGGLKIRALTNATITQYQNGNELTSLPPAP